MICYLELRKGIIHKNASLWGLQIECLPLSIPNPKVPEAKAWEVGVGVHARPIKPVLVITLQLSFQFVTYGFGCN